MGQYPIIPVYPCNIYLLSTYCLLVNIAKLAIGQLLIVKCNVTMCATLTFIITFQFLNVAEMGTLLALSCARGEVVCQLENTKMALLVLILL